MFQWVSTAGDIASASTALGGLLLVFLGSIVNAFGSYRPEDQGTVRRKYIVKGSLAFAGFVLALAAAALALDGKLTENADRVVAATWCLGVSFALVIAAGFLSILEMK